MCHSLLWSALFQKITYEERHSTIYGNLPKICQHLLQLCNTTQKNILYYCWQEKTDGANRSHPGVSLVSASEQMSARSLSSGIQVH